MSEKLKSFPVRGPFKLPKVSAFASKAWYYREGNRLSIYIQTLAANICSVKIPLSVIKNYVRTVETWNRRAKGGKRA